MDTLVQSIARGPYRIEIHHDDIRGGDSPRDWCNLGTMACAHRRYNLGDEQVDPDTFLRDLASEFFDVDAYDAASDEAKARFDEKVAQIIEANYIMLPLYLYDHSGITMNTSGFSDHWDSGHVGFIYVSRKKVREEYGWKRITKKRREQIESYLRNEVAVYDAYLRGAVYGYQIDLVEWDEDGDVIEEIEHVDSCWGFYDAEGMLEAINSNLEDVDPLTKDDLDVYFVR